MTSFDLTERPHRRFNPLTAEWVLVSPHRTQRPWQGLLEKPAATHQPQYDPSCYMCPGNTRATGVRNPAYTNTFVFDNDYPALLPDTPETDESPPEALMVARPERGINHDDDDAVPRHADVLAGNVRGPAGERQGHAL